MRESETIIERARLREAEEEDACWMGNAVVNQRSDQIEQGLMMNRNWFFTAKVSQPSETEAKWTTTFTRFPDVLVKSLQRSDRKRLWRHLLRFTHHLLFVCAVTVQCDQQRRRRRRARPDVVIKINACVENAVEFRFHRLRRLHWFC